MRNKQDNSVVAVVLRSMHRKMEGEGMIENYICPKCGKPYHSYKKEEEDHSIVECWTMHLEEDHKESFLNDPPPETDEE